MVLKKALLIIPLFSIAAAAQQFRINDATTGVIKNTNSSAWNDAASVKDTINSGPIVQSNVNFNEKEVTAAVAKSENPKFLLMANLAKSWRVASSPDNLTAQEKKYYKELKSGSSYDFSAYYITNQSNGVGLKYNVFSSDAVLRNQVIDFGNGNFISGDIADNIKISFIGPSFIISDNLNGKLGEPSLELALGYMAYRNDASIVGNPVKITGGDVGIVGGLGYHFKVRPNFLIGPQFNFAGSVLKKLKYTYEDGSTQTIKLNEEEYENLLRIDLAIGAKFRF
ncbi:hypothetical protein L1S34_05565 [Flavobacterium sp. K77]|uniref:hypothetical protein n=1 Tax=Flavobacterium sp. K77 TaxID=2910676 RepID=UPI001F2D3EB4|nr:hypothetical protein [Flavobacterium sp. K77]MCF6140747.1 hypothetical protein [Flavobacterium sp. K77]